MPCSRASRGYTGAGAWIGRGAASLASATCSDIGKPIGLEAARIGWASAGSAVGSSIGATGASTGGAAGRDAGPSSIGERGIMAISPSMR